MKHITRSTYLNRLLGSKNTPDIKIITGLRRSGKSELLHDFIKCLKDDTKTNIIFIDYFDLEFEHLKNYKELHKYVKDKFVEDKLNYLLIDEIQLCDKFELTINSLHNNGNFDIYLTGSNAFLLSSDLTTLFTGRFIEIPVFPFSFSEYLKYNENEDIYIETLFDNYVVQGGLSGSYVYSNEVDRIAYLKDVFKTIVNRDLVDKYNISDTLVLDKLAEYLMDNISNLSSPNNISETLCLNNVATNHVTVNKFIKYLCNAFMFYQVKRYDIKGKKYLKTSEKYYLSDLGFRFSQLGNRNMDYGRCYENIVCIELLRRGYDVYVGKLYNKEIDFVAIRNNEKIYIQVSDDISNKETFQREVTSLLQVKDAYPKMLIARTRHDEYQYEGIRVVNLATWLKDFK
ncbi:MAG: ATP-binding protein [Erysipelotrichia bacterium]|nr:ATP-binding protein [Erysipelotrichia bacterium]